MLALRYLETQRCQSASYRACMENWHKWKLIMTDKYLFFQKQNMEKRDIEMHL